MIEDSTVICSWCGEVFDDVEDFESRGDGMWCNLESCVNNPVCGSGEGECQSEHADWHFEHGVEIG